MRVSVLSALVALVALAAVAAPATVAADACNGDDYGTAAHMDWPGCSNPTNWQVHNLTLHGMWPNYDQSQSGHEWPQCCQSTYGTDIDPAVAKALLPEFQTYWPNEQDPSGGDLSTSLWAHEWQKHGTCSGLPQKQYFQSAMNIELSIGTPAVISNNIGSSCALSDLQAAFNASSCSGDCMAGFSCQSQNGQQYLAGITTCWDTTLTQQICPAAVFSGGQCTDDTIYIQSF